MFTIKNAIMEVLSKTKSLGDVLSKLSEENKAAFLAAFGLMKAKLNGTDSFSTQDNGQWTLEKTLDKPTIGTASEPQPAATINYSGLEPKVTVHDNKAYTKDTGKPKPWAGARERRDQALRNANISPIKKDEDKIKAIKEKYKEPKEIPEEIKIKQIKEKYRQQDKEQAVAPEKAAIKISAKEIKSKTP